MYIYLPGRYTPKTPPPNGTGGNFIGFVPVSVRSVRNITASSKGWALNSTFGNGDFNPAPWVFPNGTTLLMWRHLARVHMVRSPRIGAILGSSLRVPLYLIRVKSVASYIPTC